MSEWVCVVADPDFSAAPRTPDLCFADLAYMKINHGQCQIFFMQPNRSLEFPFTALSPTHYNNLLQARFRPTSE